MFSGDAPKNYIAIFHIHVQELGKAAGGTSISTFTIIE